MNTKTYHFGRLRTEQSRANENALTEGSLLTRFMTPDLITDDAIRSAFEMLAPQRPRKRASL
jgi:hypothetical protein